MQEFFEFLKIEIILIKPPIFCFITKNFFFSNYNTESLLNYKRFPECLRSLDQKMKKNKDI